MKTRIDVSTKLQAVSLILLMLAVPFAAFASDTELQNEQINRLTALKNRAAAGKTTIGDMHEAAAHYRILAARLRDSGLETKLDAYLRDPANQTRLMNSCVTSGYKGVDQTTCQSALSLLRTNGSHITMQAIAAVAYSADLWAPNLIPTLDRGGAHLLPVILPNCRGVGQAIAAGTFIAGALLIFPGGQPAGTVGGAFLLFIALVAAGVC